MITGDLIKLVKLLLPACVSELGSTLLVLMSPTSQVTFALLISCLALTCSSELMDEECLEKGFNRQSLKCSSCDLLEKYNLEVITESCQECCEEDNVIPDGGKKYPKAVLEVCWCKFPTMPQIEAFVKGPGSKKFANLQTKHVNGLPPIIKMYNSAGQVEQTLSISKWDTDTIEEFLSTYLEP